MFSAVSPSGTLLSGHEGDSLPKSHAQLASGWTGIPFRMYTMSGPPKVHTPTAISVGRHRRCGEFQDARGLGTLGPWETSGQKIEQAEVGGCFLLSRRLLKGKSTGRAARLA